MGLGLVLSLVKDRYRVEFGTGLDIRALKTVKEVYNELELLFNNPTLTVRAWPPPAYSSEY